MMTDDCREAFEKKFKTLDFTKTRDAWDREIYAHSHIQAMFYGWQAAWNTRTPPAGDAPKDKHNNEWFFRWIARAKAGFAGMTYEQCIDVIWHSPLNPYSKNNPWAESDAPKPAGDALGDDSAADDLVAAYARLHNKAQKAVQAADDTFTEADFEMCYTHFANAHADLHNEVYDGHKFMQAYHSSISTPAKPDISALIAEVMVGMKATGDSYYCKALDLADKNCRGSQYKLENGKFTDDDLKWHCQHHELIGKHRGLYEALEKLTAAMKDKGL